MAFCSDCGAQIPDEIKFCTECGKPLNETPQAVPAMASAKTYGEASVSVKSQPQQTNTPDANSLFSGDTAPARGSRYAVMSVKAYIGYSVLFSIPVIGWAICLIMSFTSRSLNKRNFAKAMLILILIGVVLSVVFYFVFGWMSEIFIKYMHEAANGATGDFDGAKGIFDMMK